MPIFTNKDKWGAAEEGCARRTELDAGDRRSYDRAVSKDPPSEQPRAASDDAERERVVRILDAALELSERERAQIAAILTDSIGDGSAPEEVQASWIAEAKRRLAAHERGETSALDSDEVIERLRTGAASLHGREGRAVGAGVRATVRNGRLFVDQEIELPEGTELELVIDDEGDDLDERELAALNAAISRSLDQAARGEVNPAEKILARLRERRR